MTNEMIIGPVTEFQTVPAQVEMDGTPYWLIREEEGGYALLMAICPHAGGEVRIAEGLFFCPLHFWTFDIRSGSCLNQADERLARRNVEERGGILFAVGDPY